MNHKEECSDFAERMTVTSLIIVEPQPSWVCPIVAGSSSTMITRSGTHSSSNHLTLMLCLLLLWIYIIFLVARMLCSNVLVEVISC